MLDIVCLPAVRQACPTEHMVRRGISPHDPLDRAGTHHSTSHQLQLTTHYFHSVNNLLITRTTADISS